MDSAVAAPMVKRWYVAAVAVVLCIATGFALFHYFSNRLAVPVGEIQTELVKYVEFVDQVGLNAKVDPLVSTDLDSVESGRVEEIFVQDGMAVKRGQQLFRLSNPDRELQVLQRRTEVAQQISNLSTLQVQFELGESERRRRVAAAVFEAEQAEIKLSRETQLVEKGFISSAAIQLARDTAQQKIAEQRQEAVRSAEEVRVQKKAIEQFQSTLSGLRAGLAIADSSLSAFVVRAPMDGQLTDFHLKIGQVVQANQHLGRVDDTSSFRLLAEADEFYLSKAVVGTRGTADYQGMRYPVIVQKTFPQVKDGKFLVEMKFLSTTPQGLQPGQNVTATLSLGSSTQVLALANHAFPRSPEGAVVYVMNANGTGAVRREVRLGRRNQMFLEILGGLKENERVITSDYAKYIGAAEIKVR